MSLSKPKLVTPKQLTTEVHVNHIFDPVNYISKTIDVNGIFDLYNKDSYSWYFVYEMGWGNFARIHLISEASADEALQSVTTYLHEKESLSCENDNPLTGVTEIELSKINREL